MTADFEPVDGGRRGPREVTLASLYASGRLTSEDNAAANELAAMSSAFSWLVGGSVTAGYASGGGGSSGPRSVGDGDWPLALRIGSRWKRYKAWRSRHGLRIVRASPIWPWGRTRADLVMAVLTEPLSLSGLAACAGLSVADLEDLFVAALRDYWGGYVRVDNGCDLAQALADDRRQSLGRRLLPPRTRKKAPPSVDTALVAVPVAA